MDWLIRQSSAVLEKIHEAHNDFLLEQSKHCGKANIGSQTSDRENDTEVTLNAQNLETEVTLNAQNLEVECSPKNIFLKGLSWENISPSSSKALAPSNIARESKVCKEKILKLSTSDKIFLQPTDSTVNFSMDSLHIEQAKMLLKFDSRLGQVRFRLVRSQRVVTLKADKTGMNSYVEEQNFWKNYFHHVSIICEESYDKLKTAVETNSTDSSTGQKNMNDLCCSLSNVEMNNAIADTESTESIRNSSPWVFLSEESDDDSNSISQPILETDLKSFDEDNLNIEDLDLRNEADFASEDPISNLICDIDS